MVSGQMAINSDNSSGNPKTMLDLKSTTRGVMLSKTPSVQRAATGITIKEQRTFFLLI